MRAAVMGLLVGIFTIDGTLLLLTPVDERPIMYQGGYQPRLSFLWLGLFLRLSYFFFNCFFFSYWLFEYCY